jgi:hypothetical protein
MAYGAQAVMSCGMKRVLHLASFSIESGPSEFAVAALSDLSGEAGFCGSSSKWRKSACWLADRLKNRVLAGSRKSLPPGTGRSGTGAVNSVRLHLETARRA